MAYCTKTDVTLRGSYADKNITQTKISDTQITEFIDQIYMDINAKLSKNGFQNLPIGATCTNATKRLKRLNSIGTNAVIEDELNYRNDARGVTTGAVLQKSRYWEQYDSMLQLFIENPVTSLFEGDSQVNYATYLSGEEYDEGSSIYDAMYAVIQSEDFDDENGVYDQIKRDKVW